MRHATEDKWSMLIAYRFNFIWIVVLRRPYGTKTEMWQFRPNFHILGVLVPIPFTDPGQMRQRTVKQWSTLTGQISFESVRCVSFQGRKILTFMGAPVRYPVLFTDEGQTWFSRGDPQSTVTSQISSRSVYCITLWQ